MERLSKKSNYAFIDSQNLNLGIRSKGWKLDFKKFRLYLKNKYGVEKAFLFLGFVKENISLYEYFEKIGYTMIFKPIVRYKRDGKYTIKGNVDVELAMTVLLEQRNYKKAVIVSGDGDFYYLVEYLESKNILEALLVPNRKYSTLLKRYGKYILRIENLRGLLEKKKAKINGRSKP